MPFWVLLSVTVTSISVGIGAFSVEVDSGFPRKIRPTRERAGQVDGAPGRCQRSRMHGPASNAGGTQVGLMFRFNAQRPRTR